MEEVIDRLLDGVNTEPKYGRCPLSRQGGRRLTTEDFEHARKLMASLPKYGEKGEKVAKALRELVNSLAR